MNSSEPDFDIGVIGGGPAGAAVAAYLAQAGARVVVFEGEHFPRPHVGESFVPSSTRVFKDLGFLDQMEKYNFPRKFGAIWTVSSSSMTAGHGWDGLEPDCRADIRFEERDQMGVDQNYTYHVDRGLFDKVFLEHAEKLGATVYQGVTVNNVDFSSEFVKVSLASEADGQRDVKVRMVVDASGRRTFLGNRLNLKVKDRVFDQYAIHTWFDNYERSYSGKDASDKGDYIYIHFIPITNSWIWQIPITDTITSIGLVTQKMHFKGTKEERAQFFWDTVAMRPELEEKLKRATQMRPFTEEGDYSYAMSQIAGDRFVLIGDAARFVDPIFSSGVSIALNSARLASADIIAALEAGDFSRERFRNFETTIKWGTRNWYEFITVYYRLNILFTAFINDPRYRLDVLKLLQGDLYEEVEPPVLAHMREIISEVESNPRHIWHKLLGDLSSENLKSTLVTA